MTRPVQAKAFQTLDDLDPRGRRVLLRVDLNVPMEGGRIGDATRIERILPSIRELADRGARVVLLSHFGRPKGVDASLSLRPVAAALSDALQRPIAFTPDCIGEAAEAAVANLGDGEILCLENTRFHAGEERNDPAFIDALARLGEIYVNDAFSAAHRAHASTEGLAHRMPAYAGRAMAAELAALDSALGEPKRPVAAIVGGSKVSSKLDLLGNLVAKVDLLVIGGGMANTFLFAQGKAVGKSLCERELAGTAREILDKAKAGGCEIVLPVDAVVATELKPDVATRTVPIDDVAAGEMILDIGADSVADICAKLEDMKTLIWNGPVGAFETAPFDVGTVALARRVAGLVERNGLVAVGGGGDTVAALNHAGVSDALTYVSTAGGAFLEWMESKPLPGVEALRQAPPQG